MLVLSALGSCRVINPVRRAVSTYPVIFNNARVFGYAHSAAEIVQQIQFLKGAFDLTERLQPFLAPTTENSLWQNVCHRMSDAYVVEISSAKIVRLDKTCVQWNHVCRYFADFLQESRRARTFWSLAHPDNQDQKLAFLASDQAYKALSSHDQELLRAITLEIADHAALSRDIKVILRELPRVLFVTHVNAKLGDGSYIASRNKFIELLKSVLSSLNASCCDPSELMEHFGQDNALLTENASFTHYSEAFERALFANWYNQYLNISDNLALAG